MIRLQVVYVVIIDLDDDVVIFVAGSTLVSNLSYRVHVHNWVSHEFTFMTKAALIVRSIYLFRSVQFGCSKSLDRGQTPLRMLCILQHVEH